MSEISYKHRSKQMAKTKDMSPENRINLVTEKLITASRKAVQSATPTEALEVWKFIKTQQLKRIPGLTTEQIQTLVETQAKEIGADYIVAGLAPTKYQSGETDSYTSINELVPTVEAAFVPSNESVVGANENGAKPKSGIANSRSR